MEMRAESRQLVPRGVMGDFHRLQNTAQPFKSFLGLAAIGQPAQDAVQDFSRRFPGEGRG